MGSATRTLAGSGFGRERETTARGSRCMPLDGIAVQRAIGHFGIRRLVAEERDSGCIHSWGLRDVLAAVGRGMPSMLQGDGEPHRNAAAMEVSAMRSWRKCGASCSCCTYWGLWSAPQIYGAPRSQAAVATAVLLRCADVLIVGWHGGYVGGEGLSASASLGWWGLWGRPVVGR